MVDGEADIVAGHAVAMERRRRRLAEAAGLDPGHKRQAEFILDFQYWRADRWGVVPVEATRRERTLSRCEPGCRIRTI